MKPDEILEHLAEAVWDYSERSAGPKDWSEASPAERSDLLMDVRRVVIRLAQIAREQGVKGIGREPHLFMVDIGVMTLIDEGLDSPDGVGRREASSAWRAMHDAAPCWLQGLVEGES